MGVYDYHHDSGRSDRPGAPALYDRQPEVTAENPYKVYVEVIADFTPDGRMMPLRIVWEDGRTYGIDHVDRCDRRASLKAGGCGMRYVCRVRGQQIELFYEENGRWFVTRKVPRV